MTAYVNKTKQLRMLSMTVVYWQRILQYFSLLMTVTSKRYISIFVMRFTYPIFPIFLRKNSYILEKNILYFCWKCVWAMEVDLSDPIISRVRAKTGKYASHTETHYPGGIWPTAQRDCDERIRPYWISWYALRMRRCHFVRLPHSCATIHAARDAPATSCQTSRNWKDENPRSPASHR